MLLTEGEPCDEPRLPRGRLRIGREDEASGVTNRRASELVVEVDLCNCCRGIGGVASRCKMPSSSLARAKTDAWREAVSGASGRCKGAIVELLTEAEADEVLATDPWAEAWTWTLIAAVSLGAESRCSFSA